uniref:Condensin complex subunit 1 C-terminal domain-containing protein n=2 Tax=Parascaris TaxID=6254 RepID=A0A915ATS6_PARUN
MSEIYKRSLVINSKVDSGPSKARKKLLAARERKANILRRQNLSREDLSRLLEKAIEVSESRLATAEFISQFLNDLAIALRNAEAIDDEELFTAICKRVARYLLCDFQCIRAVGMRILRLACTTESSLVILLRNHVDMFLARSLDLDVENFDERIEALKLASHMLRLYSNANMKIRARAAEEGKMAVDYLEGIGTFLFPHSLILPILAIARTVFVVDGDKPTNAKPDGLAFASLAIFVELAISEPDVIIEIAGTGWLVEALAGPIVSNSRLSAVVCRVLYVWLDCPRLRAKAKMHMVLEQIFSPLIEISFFQSSAHITDTKTIAPHQQIVDMLNAFTHSFATVLCSWPGLLACAASDENAKTVVSSQLRLLEFLGLGTVTNPSLRKIRGMIVEACCHYLDRPYAAKTFETWVDAVRFYSTMHYPDSFKCSLRDDFVLSEHEVHIASMKQFSEHVDLLASFRAMVVFFLIDAGLTQSLARFILVDLEDPISLKGTLLLNDLLLMGSSFLPLEWRSRVLCMPTLIQSACEALTRTVHTAAVDGGVNVDSELPDFTFINAGNAPLLLHRLDVLNELALSRATQPIPIGNLQIFVQSVPVSRSRSESLSRFGIDRKDGESGIDSCIHEMIVKSIDIDGQFRWWMVDGVLQLLELDDFASLYRHRHSDRCYFFFSQLLHFFTPSSSLLVSNFDGDRFSVACGCRVFRVVMPLCAIESRYEQLVQDFLCDCVNNLEPSKLSSGVFSPKNILNSGAMYYFALVGAISSQDFGREMMERTRLLQTFVDLLTSTTSVEYVKLIVSCLDYSADDGLTRVVLQTALTSTNEAGRKWSTRFLGVIAGHELQGFAEWGMSLLLAQLSDHSAKVVRHAIRLLHRWIPFYPESISLLKNVRLDALGDAGIMLKTHLFANEDYVESNPNDVQMAFNLWRKEFNARYVEVIDEDLKVAMLNVKRSLDGRFARISNDKSLRQSVPLLVHFYGQMALHLTGQQMLSKSGEVERLLDYLRRWSVSVETSQLRNVKGAILALAHIAGSRSPGALNILPTETVPVICRYAERCPILSVRGVAFWAMNLIGSSKQGARLIASLGWESNRYTEVIAEVAISGWGPPKVDDARVWVQCIDGHRNEEGEADKQSFSEVHTPPVSRSNSEMAKSSARTDVSAEILQSPVRAGRTFTIDSVIHSGFGSAPKEDLELYHAKNEEEEQDTGGVIRRRVTGPSEMADVVVFGTSIDFQKCGELHYSASVRSRFRLEPFAFSKMQVIQRSLGESIRYIYMSSTELRTYRQFRRVFTYLGEQQEISAGNESTMTVHSGWTVIALPGQADLICKDIFSHEVPKLHYGVTSALKSTEKRDSPLRIVEKKPHNEKICFYCSWSEEVFGSKVEIDEKAVPSERRAVLLSLVQLMESKHISPEKKLIKMYNAYPELFSSPCIYADVVEILAEYRYRLETRRF